MYVFINQKPLAKKLLVWFIFMVVDLLLEVLVGHDINPLIPRSDQITCNFS